MIEIFLNSIAGHKSHQAIDSLLDELYQSKTIPEQDKQILSYTKKVAAEGAYPSHDYYRMFYSESAVFNSISELKVKVKEIVEFYNKQWAEQSLIQALNASTTLDDLKNKLTTIVSDITTNSSDSLELPTPQLYTTTNTGLGEGIMTGVPELDQVTSGFQPGTIASICAFTAHGKSTFANSIAYKNALQKKKVCIVSLEVAPPLVWQSFEARYMVSEHNLDMTSQDLLFHRLASDVEEQVKELEPKFLEDIASNLMIIDESFITHDCITDYKVFSNLMFSVEDKLQGLDLVIIDHVGQLELLFPQEGNRAIKTLQSFTKTYENKQGKNPTTIFCVQTNREGEKRAAKRGGIYDMRAISSLNEIEKSSSYVVFLHTSDDSKLLQETKITLAKHRLGEVITEPVVTSFNPAIMSVGEQVEAVTLDADGFNNLDLDFDANDFSL